MVKNNKITKKCKSCQTEIDSKAKKCPNCKADQRNWFIKHKIISIVLIIILLIIISNSGNKDAKEAFEKGKQAGKEQMLNPTPTVEISPTSVSTKATNITPTLIPTKVVEVSKTDREKVIEILKANALKEWGDDYAMVKYELNKQTVAYDWVVKQTEHLDIMEKAKKEWGDDYAMVKYEYEKQVAAFNSL